MNDILFSLFIKITALGSCYTNNSFFFGFVGNELKKHVHAKQIELFIRKLSLGASL